MTLRVVSTYNPEMWDVFVRRNIGSWIDHVDAELVVYHEGPQPAGAYASVVWRQWEDIPGAKEFADEAAAFPPARGMFGTGYDYNFDAWKFARKVYAQCDAAEEDGDILLWLDSDVEVLRPFGQDLISDLLFGAGIARYERPGYHSETGVVAWNLRDPKVGEFFRGYRTLYENRRIYCLNRGWHDCWALDWVTDQVGVISANLTKGGKDYKSPHYQGLHVIPDSTLGHYLRHDKGMRKHAA